MLVDVCSSYNGASGSSGGGRGDDSCSLLVHDIVMSIHGVVSL